MGDIHRSFTRREVMGLIATSAAAVLTSGWAETSASAQDVPRGAVIRTVLQDIAPASLASAATLFHEHLSFEWARVTGRQDRPGPAQDVALLSQQLDLAAAEGVGCIVDAGTTDVGRDVDFLRQIARRTRVHIVACGGLYMQRTYPTGVASMSENQIADDL